ncbi:Holliday junction resolvase [archaeon]|nr:Holliday junction resolvase [archaeon]|tara:strand:+ start:200 stop:589 length:390 start_codon:yes stop_codon:yes gene_type:complete
MSKKKGTRLERELFHMLFEAGWQPCRFAGSGSTPLPAVDIIAGNAGRVLAIECKATKKDKKYIEEEKILELKDFSERFGAEPWVGMRFNNMSWFFLSLDNMERSKKGSFIISKDIAKKKGLEFDDLIKS